MISKLSVTKFTRFLKVKSIHLSLNHGLSMRVFAFFYICSRINHDVVPIPELSLSSQKIPKPDTDVLQLGLVCLIPVFGLVTMIPFIKVNVCKNKDLLLYFEGAKHNRGSSFSCDHCLKNTIFNPARNHLLVKKSATSR